MIKILVIILKLITTESRNATLFNIKKKRKKHKYLDRIQMNHYNE